MSRIAPIAITLAATFAAGPALAETVHRMSPHAVSDTVDRLERAITEAGATVFARVNHAEGASSAGMELPPSELLIFGNPQLGTLPQQADIRAGLALPMKVLTYQAGDGSTHMIYETPETLFEGLDVPGDAEYLAKMSGALEKFTTAATAEE
ncbi:DUF302 domain-containing protein [Litorisediminicola beolgyonensis]|uniref:DUF302 domain-containing protein n=1 Tax=Litorisediminicola beolgyonensis TaxID=1173614 RepID=A0ABW3ZNF0_9RHOB